MSMYKIIGSDSQAYGPASMEQLQHWLAENRIRADTLVQPEGSQEWKPLSSFPELIVGLNLPPPPPPGIPPTINPPTQTTHSARASNKIPAGVCGILLGGLGIHKFILGYTGAGLIMLLVTLLTCGLATPITHLIGLIEGIIYLTKSDEEFVRTYVEGRREWF